MSGDSPPPPKKRRWLRRLLITSGILGLAVYCFFRDEKLQPADDLTPQRPEIAWDDNNGWKRLATFARGIPAISPTAEYLFDDVLQLRGEPNLADMKKYSLTDGQLTQLEDIAAMPRFQAKVHVHAEDEYDEDLKALRTLRDCFDFTLVSAAGDGDAPRVLRILKTSSSLQKRMTGGATGIGSYGRATGWIDESCMALTLIRLDWKLTELEELAALLANDPVAPDDLHEAMRREFLLLRQTVLDFEDFPPDPNEGRPGHARLPIPPRFLFQRNRTVNLLAKSIRGNLILALVAPWSEIESRRDQWGQREDSLLSYLDTNRYGKRIVSGFIHPGAWEWQWRGDSARRRAMQVIVALLRWQKARGSLPAALDALVPEFLPAVPLDPFDFEPLRWHPAERAVQVTNFNGVITPLDPKQIAPVSVHRHIFLFRTKAEEDARRASLPKPKVPASPAPPAGGANK